MEKLKQYKYVILLGMLILVLLFYWFEYRPLEARKKCSDDAQRSVNLVYSSSLDKGSSEELRLNQIFYQNCMRGTFGLEPKY